MSDENPTPHPHYSDMDTEGILGECGIIVQEATNY